MRRYTTAELLDAAINDDFGEPVTRTAVREQNTVAGPLLLNVPLGKVALVTGITLQAGAGKQALSTNYQPSPQPSVAQINVAGYGSASFLSFRRPETHFMGTATPTARAAPPGNVVKWKPRHPIPIPGVAVAQGATLGDFGNHSCVDMVLVDAAHAASLGIDINTSAAKSRHQLQSAIALSTPAAIVTGRKGLHTRIKDIYIRLQPAVLGTNEVRIYQKGNTANNGDTTEVTIWRFANDNLVDALDIAFSPDEIFLRAGADLFISTTISNSASVAVSAVFEDPSECDANVFWAALDPAKPGTSATSVPTGFGGTGRKSNVAFTPYYPKTNTIGPVTPGRGHQFFVRGVTASVQKATGRFYAAGSTMVVDQTLFTISQGATSGDVQFTLGFALAQPNPQIIPTLYATEHNQNVLLVDDSKNCICKPDDGQIWFNSLNMFSDGSAGSTATGSVATADANITAWGFTVWGRRISTRFKTPQLLGA